MINKLLYPNTFIAICKLKAFNRSSVISAPLWPQLQTETVSLLATNRIKYLAITSVLTIDLDSNYDIFNM